MAVGGISPCIFHSVLPVFVFHFSCCLSHPSKDTHTHTHTHTHTFQQWEIWRYMVISLLSVNLTQLYVSFTLTISNLSHSLQVPRLKPRRAGLCFAQNNGECVSLAHKTAGWGSAGSLLADSRLTLTESSRDIWRMHGIK
uniref:Uncharacterized protein n=1 Tax=Rousettus aegyptiacus TaxID=9407 RepID=A0A7J8DHZ6_ROUAE|nr:hypothetical protein HJG63_008618 [Rousettus aegyptiacus]